MGTVKSDNSKWLITLTVMTLSSFHCILIANKQIKISELHTIRKTFAIKSINLNNNIAIPSKGNIIVWSIIK